MKKPIKPTKVVLGEFLTKEAIPKKMRKKKHQSTSNQTNDIIIQAVQSIVERNMRVSQRAVSHRLQILEGIKKTPFTKKES